MGAVVALLCHPGGNGDTPVSPMGAVVTFLCHPQVWSQSLQSSQNPDFLGRDFPEKHFPSPKRSRSTSRALQAGDVKSFLV